MDTYQNRKRLREATALCERLVTDGLGRKEHTVLQVLAAAMGQVSMIEESKMLGDYLECCFHKWLSSYLENGSAASKKVPKPKPSSLRSLAPEEDLDDEDQDPVQSTSYGSDYDDDEPMLDEDGELYEHDPDADDPPYQWVDPDDEGDGGWEDE